ncbi:AfsR/SARP family transcriptional regulator [Kitasatospora kifunensis]|uniref:DNA-binding SARP family transcriptional activator n=1 Tax=Kitasatospora kifunensis TaxID=58351 RepID=A0A7W7QWL7_KITKI|nr:AfsR/SARP family transcriptional regulator [Kitasatospora kifunensis]MBB4921123.1 DNA-binding SARP family transcriptional activator [Kitasatospora kifunensis]
MEFKILGSLEIWADGVRVRLAGSRQERLLAMLLLNANTVVPIGRLVDAVWGERPPATAGRQVRNLAAGLRRSFTEAAGGRVADLISTDGPGYRLTLQERKLDAQVFAAHLACAHRAQRAGEHALAVGEYRAALDLWRGPALGGLADGNRQAGRPLTAGAVGLDEQRLACWENCLELELGLDRHREVVPELSALVAEHPLRARFTAQLMLALQRSGRQADALDLYRRLAARLCEELGLDPAPELQLLRQRLLRTEG